MKSIAKGVVTLVVCAAVFPVPGIASADSELAHTYLKENEQCDLYPSANAWYVINDLKDSSVNATVRVDWTQGTDKGNTQNVYNLGPGQSRYVACKKSFITGEFPIDRRASVVGAEEA